MRLFVLGLDGAAWRVLDPLIAQGAMPALERLKQQGASGVLWSTRPPITPTAWSSFQTGTLPGKHGVYGFQRVSRTPEGLQFRVVDAASIEGPTLWDRLGWANKRVAIVNLPLTYPPRPVPGVLITGFPTPSQRSPYTYPPELKEELLEVVPDYRVPTWEFDGPVDDRHVEKFVRALIHMARARQRAARHLMNEYPWDLFVLQFQETDFLQHPLWHHLDPEHPHFSPRQHDVVADFFRRLDELIGQILDELAEDDLVLVLSDHGFQRAERTCYVNRWLLQAGWLALHRRRRSLAPRLLEALKRFDVLHLRRRWLPRAVQEELKHGWARLKFDWHTSRAYADADHSGCFGLYLLNGADPEIVVKELLALEDPERGAPVVERVLTAEEAFGPKPAPGAPDLLVELGEGYSALPDVDAGRGAQGPLFASYRPGRDHQIGIHHPEGILIAHGPGVPERDDLEARLVDIAPTVLYHLGLPVPTAMDGDVVREIYAPEVLERDPIRYLDEDEADSRVGEGARRGLTPEEEEQVRKHLKDLGYL